MSTPYSSTSATNPSNFLFGGGEGGVAGNLGQGPVGGDFEPHRSLAGGGEKRGSEGAAASGLDSTTGGAHHSGEGVFSTPSERTALDPTATSGAHHPAGGVFMTPSESPAIDPLGRADASRLESARADQHALGGAKGLGIGGDESNPLWSSHNASKTTPLTGAPESSAFTPSDPSHQKPHDEQNTKTDEQKIKAGDPIHGTHEGAHKPSMGEKIAGTVEASVGKVTGKPEKVEEGRIMKTEGKEAAKKAHAAGPADVV